MSTKCKAGASITEAETETKTLHRSSEPSSVTTTTPENLTEKKSDELSGEPAERTNDDERYAAREYRRYSQNLGNGYCGRSTSVNSLIAREMGSFPLGEWSKAKMMNGIKKIAEGKAVLFQKIPLPVLKIYCLRRTGYHHTSKFFNETDFYELNEEAIRSLPDDTLMQLAKLKKPKPVVEKTAGRFRYIVWEKCRGPYGKYMKPNEITLDDVNIEATGSFFTVRDKTGRLIVRKKIGSTGTEVGPFQNRPISRQVADFLGIEPCDTYSLYRELATERFDRSSNGDIYQKDREPSQEDIDNGLGNFFTIGERRVKQDCFGNYRVEKWNGRWWIDDADTEPIA